MAAGTRTYVVAIGAALAGLVLAACASPAKVDRTPTPEEALARVQGVAAKVTEARSARISMTASTTYAGEAVALSTATTVGVYDFAASKGQMDTTVKMAGEPLRFTERTLVIGSAIYTKMPEPPPDLADGSPPVPAEHHKPWIKFEMPRELAGLNGFELGPGLGGPGPGDGSGDPTEALGFLKDASSEVSVVGNEQVRGVATTHYTVTLDMARQTAQLPAEVRHGVEESGLAFARPADVWIDDQGRLRKIHYAVTMSSPDQGTTSARMTLDTTMELYDFGVEVNVVPPPASQVEVIRPDALPAECARGKGSVKAGSSSGGAKAGQDTSQAQAWACAEALATAP